MALDMPAFGSISERIIAPDLFSLSIDPGDSGVLGERGDLPKQDLVAGEPEVVADPIALAPGHGFMAGIVAVAANTTPEREPLTDYRRCPPDRSGNATE